MDSTNSNNNNGGNHHFQAPPPVSSAYSPQGPMPTTSQPQSLQGSPNSSTVNLSGPGSFSALPPPPQTAYPATSSSHHHHPHSTFSSLSSQMVNLQVGSMPSSANVSPVMSSMAPVGSASATPGTMTPTSSSTTAQHGSLYFNPPSHPGGHYTVSSAYTSTQQQQHYSNHQSPSMSTSPLPGPKDAKPLMTGTSTPNASFYYYGATSPQQQTQSLPPQQQQQHQQQQQQQQSHQSHQSHQQQTSTGFQTPQQPLRPQYASLVPPLTDAQYAQYHQLLGSPFSSAPSTPYHSNHSTPYSSMPASPTLEYQQLAGGSSATGADGSTIPMQQKPKRRQVKNACVNCQKACKKCDEGRPCQRCIKYGLTDTCVDSTRKVRKKGVKRGPYKRRPPPVQVGSASASTTPVLTHATLPGGPGGSGPTGPAGYMSEPVSQLNSPTQSHMTLPFATSNIGHLPSTLDFYNDSANTGNYSFQPHRMDSQGGPGGSQQQTSSQQQSYMPPYTTSYSGQPLYASPYVPNNLPPNMS
ncbi:hypothetical protein BGZ73_009100 [Actinomortierella ambigua]|nr:hypothetical protein BGZ73_009100 [Actinomortierella ambigua]